MLTAINVAGLGPPDDPFVRLQTRTPLHWIKLSGLPPQGAARHVMGIRLSRYRAALQTVAAASAGRFIVSHTPHMTAAVAHLLPLRGHKVPHLGFAFNFTALPTGARYRYIRQAMLRMEQLAVFSRFEQDHYAAYFDVAPELFKPVLWTQDLSPVAVGPREVFAQPYLCAIGGEGRDFPLLLEAARRLGPSVTVVIIARPGNLRGLAVPENVTALTNLPLPEVWRIASASRGVLVPLLSRDTCCGQITLVGAKLLGLPIVTTDAYATQEYVQGRDAVLVVEPGDAVGFARGAARLVEDAQAMTAAAQASATVERQRHDRSHWAAYLDEFVGSKVLSAA